MARFAAGFAVLMCLVAAARVGADSSVGTQPYRARIDAAGRAYATALAQYKTGVGVVETVYTWSKRQAEAQRDAHGVVPAAAAQEHLQRMVALEKLAQQQVAAGMRPTLDNDAAAYYVADAELLAGK